jgi:lipopolysaccharide/colanic/teichoic acid biosynthesis glycosyltransferase
MTQIRLPRALSAANSKSDQTSSIKPEILDEEAFKRAISIERKRTERSKEPFLLMLLEAGTQFNGNKAKALDQIVSALTLCIRETDVIGWYSGPTTVGVLYTGLTASDRNMILSTILNKVSAALRDELSSEQLSGVSISFHFFPDDWDDAGSGGISNSVLYPDIVSTKNRKQSVLIVKRMIDIVGSCALLIICLPLFLLIAVLIKLTSRGPILFKQERVGQYGKRFTFLKFRSMTSGNDSTVHREYVIKLIANKGERQPAGNRDEGIYKLTNDYRITRLGMILRKTSMDELPQFINVLKGEMSLVGPRPPIPYELAVYQIWHRRRLLEVKPGITGLWQVSARSSVKFDDMVRLDLRYATTWTPWLDLKIILMTPIAVINGAGAC